MRGVSEYRLEPFSDSRRIALEPVKRLDNAHCWPPAPEELAGGFRLEANYEVSRRE